MGVWLDDAIARIPIISTGRAAEVRGSTYKLIVNENKKLKRRAATSALGAMDATHMPNVS